MRLIRRLTDFRSDYRDSISLLLLLLFRCRFHSSVAAYRLFEIALRKHDYLRAETICRFSAARYGRVLDVVSMMSILSFKAGDLDNGFSSLSECLKSRDFRALERILFRTGSRPASLSQRVVVLDRIAESQDVLFSHRCYARIAQCYQVLKLEDRDLAKALIFPLKDLIILLTRDFSVALCEKPNRENRGKILVSLCTASYHIALLLQDNDLLQFAFDSAFRFSEKINYQHFNADACLRMSSNLSRCISVGLLLPSLSFERGNEKIIEAIANLEASIIELCLPAQIGRRYATQENHLALMAALQADLRLVLASSCAVPEGTYAHLAELLNHSSSKSLTAVIKQRLQGMYGA